MTSEQIVTFARRAFRVARGEIVAVSALFVLTLGVMTFVEVADDRRARRQAAAAGSRPAAPLPSATWRENHSHAADAPQRPAAVH